MKRIRTTFGRLGLGEHFRLHPTSVSVWHKDHPTAARLVGSDGLSLPLAPLTVVYVWSCTCTSGVLCPMDEVPLASRYRSY